MHAGSSQGHRGSRRTSRSRGGRRRAGGGTLVKAWTNDPGAPSSTGRPIRRSAPDLASLDLPIDISDSEPAPGLYPRATRAFRYWAAAEALGRGSELWGSILPASSGWHSTVGPELTVHLDAGTDLNAFYDRQSLQFFHDTVAGQTVYSGESPDVVCHELGHAVLDAARPQLWNAMSVEVASFHESFGDISAILSALQLRVFRERVLNTTGGDLDQSTRLSRLAEQLGWAIRQLAPSAVDPDCLRNAFNSFFYQDPATLPPSAPASQLSSEEHSFSRVFTGAFFYAIGLMLNDESSQDQATLRQISFDAGTLLVNGVLQSPVVAAYYSQVAAHVIAEDAQSFGGKYGDALRSAFVTFGILSPSAALTATDEAEKRPLAEEDEGGPGRRRAAADTDESNDLQTVTLTGRDLGFETDVRVSAPGGRRRFSVASAAPDTGSVRPPSARDAAAVYVEDLVRRGQVDTGRLAGIVPSRTGYVTHVLERDDEGLVLRRILIR